MKFALLLVASCFVAVTAFASDVSVDTRSSIVSIEGKTAAETYDRLAAQGATITDLTKTMGEQSNVTYLSRVEFKGLKCIRYRIDLDDELSEEHYLCTHKLK